MKQRIKTILSITTMVTTCSILAQAVFAVVLNHVTQVPAAALWEIPLVSFLCGCTTLIYPENRGMEKKEMYVRIGIQYLLVNAIVMGLGALWNWYHVTSAASVIETLISVAVIFAIVSVATWTPGTRETDELNEQLKKR